MATDPDQRTLDFNPIEMTPAERERSRRQSAQWTREEAEEDFHQLPGESLREFFKAREAYLDSLDTFGPLFPKEQKVSEAWQMVQGQGRAPPAQSPRQLTLPFDTLKPRL